MKKYAPFALRLGLGGLFVFAGIMKLVNPAMVTQMLEGIGFPGPELWAWLLIFLEFVCGAAVLVGFKLKYVTVPLVIIMIVASIVASQGGALIPTNVAIISGLVSLWLSGPGAWGLDKA